MVTIDFINLVIDFKIDISVHFNFMLLIILNFDSMLSLDLSLLEHLLEVHQATYMLANYFIIIISSLEVTNFNR